MKKVISLTLVVIMIMSVLISFTGSSMSEKIIPSLNISAGNISYSVSDSLYGISLENRGNAIDGGLVSNLVNNNSFEYRNNPVAAWKISAETYSIMAEDGLNEQNKNYLSLTVNGQGQIENTGYSEFYNYKTYQVNSKKSVEPDMPFKAKEIYRFSAYFKNIDYVGTLTASLNAEGNKEKYQFNIDTCDEWTLVSLEIRSDITADGSLLLSFEGQGSFCMDYVTLIPMSSYGFGSDEWQYVSLRSDLVKTLHTLSPSFIRFTAGEFDNSTKIEEIGSWKDTIGPIETRKQSYTHISKNVFSINSNLMGLYEYFLLCEDLGCLAIPVINCGIVPDASEKYEKEKAKRTSSAAAEEWKNYLDSIAYCPETEEFNQYVQDVLDLIEYANGDESTLWGVKRVEDGHKESFNLKYIAIGNSSYDELYWRNFDAIYNAIQEKYPEIKIIACMDSNVSDEKAEKIRINANGLYNNIIVEENACVDGGKLFGRVNQYDEYERSGTQVAISEYSVDTTVGDTLTKNNIWSAIENAAFLMGVEKNADLVRMISYETPLAKINAQIKDTSLVWFDSQNAVLTPDYYTQMLFANNVGTNHISIDDDSFNEEGIYCSITVDTNEKVIYVKIVNSTKTPHKININVDGFKNVNNPSAQYMSENFKSACNEPNEDLHVAPVQAELTVNDNIIPYDVGGYSINVIRIPYGTNDGSKLFDLPETDLIVPFIPSFIGIIISCVMIASIFITGAVILLVRLRHHKRIKKK